MTGLALQHMNGGSLNQWLYQTKMTHHRKSSVDPPEGFDKLEKVKGQYSPAKIPNELNASIGKQIIQGVVYIHASGKVHGDLKSANILVDINPEDTRENQFGMNARISDFGSMRSIAGSMSVVASSIIGSTTGGTLHWEAPELLSGEDDEESRRSSAVDVYSLGCILGEILLRTMPFVGQSDKLVLLSKLSPSDPVAQFLSEGGSEPRWCPFTLADFERHKVSLVFRDLINSCCHPIPSQRPTAEEVYIRWQSAFLEPNIKYFFFLFLMIRKG
jgi:serine/threonine protein kinase